MHFPDLWYFESVLRSWDQRKRVYGEPVFAGPHWHDEMGSAGPRLYNVSAILCLP
mgnify:CR=1 FL=1